VTHYTSLMIMIPRIVPSLEARVMCEVAKFIIWAGGLRNTVEFVGGGGVTAELLDTRSVVAILANGDDGHAAREQAK